jgi:outer membrane protein assembly factor BamB
MPHKKIKPFLSAAFFIACLLLLAAGCAGRTTVAPPPPLDSTRGTWPQFQNDIFNSGVTTAPAPLSAPSVAWKQRVGNNDMAGVNVAPLVAGGNVYILDAFGAAWAFDAGTGARKWATQLSEAGMNFQLATPAYDDGRLFLACNDGYVYALDAAGGRILWKKNIKLASKDSQLNTAVKCAGGKIYVGAWNPDARSDEYYYCLDAATGKPGIGRKYRVPNTAAAGGYYWAGSCVAECCLIFGSERSVLTCLDKDSGQLLDSLDLKDIEPEAKEIRSSISCDPGAGMIYLTDQARNDGSCWAFDLDPTTGKLTYRWRTRLGFSSSTPAVYNGRLYVGTGTFSLRGGLYCLDAQTGSVLWEFLPTGKEVTSVPGVQASPVVSAQNGVPYIYFPTTWENSSVICLDQDGNQLWEFRDRDATYTLQGVALADGWLYFGNDRGLVYALRPAITPPKV